MTEHEINMEEHWQEIQSELASRGFLIYPNSILSTEGKAPWPTKEGITKFLDLAEKIDRKVIYIDTYKFDSEDAIDLLFLTAPEDLVDYEVETVKDCLRSLGVETSEEAKDYLKITKFYDGHLQNIRVEWIYEGIIHSYWIRAGWYGDISKLAVRVTDLIE